MQMNEIRCPSFIKRPGQQQSQAVCVCLHSRWHFQTRKRNQNKLLKKRRGEERRKTKTEHTPRWTRHGTRHENKL